MATFSSNETFGGKLNGVIAKLITGGATLNADVSIGSLFFLQSFYFEWGEIVKDYTDAFKTDKDAYKSKLFPDGWWNFFNFWYKTDTFTTALSDVKSSEKFRCNGNTIINTTYGDDWVEQNKREGIQGVPLRHDEPDRPAEFIPALRNRCGHRNLLISLLCLCDGRRHRNTLLASVATKDIPSKQTKACADCFAAFSGNSHLGSNK